MFTDSGPGGTAQAITASDVYGGAIASSTGGGVQVADTSSGNANGYGSAIASAAPSLVTMTWGVGLTLAVLAYLYLSHQGGSGGQA